MNRRRRRIAKARRRKTRLVRELSEWTKSGWTHPPRRGRLRSPVDNLMRMTDALLLHALGVAEEILRPVLAFARARRDERERLINRLTSRGAVE